MATSTKDGYIRGVKKIHPKHWHDLTADDIDRLPANATGRGPKNNEAVARFELMVEQLRSLHESNIVTFDPKQLMDGIEEYCQELEKLLYRGSRKKSSVARAIPENDQKRLEHCVELFVHTHGELLIEYAASQIIALGAKRRPSCLSINEVETYQRINSFIARARGEHVGHSLSPHMDDWKIDTQEWASFAPYMSSLRCGSMLPQLQNKLKIHLPRIQDRTLLHPKPQVGLVEDQVGTSLRSTPMQNDGILIDDDEVTESMNLNENIGDHVSESQYSSTDDGIQVDGKYLPGSDIDFVTDSDEEQNVLAQDPLPVIRGHNMLSGFDYVSCPFPENRAFEVSNSRRITRDLTSPGIYSDGLRVEDLINVPVPHCRKPGTFKPHLKKRAPLGPYEVAKAFFSLLGITSQSVNKPMAKPLPGPGIIPRAIGHHRKHKRHGVSRIVKPGKKSVFRLRRGNSKADQNSDPSARRDSNVIDLTSDDDLPANSAAEPIILSDDLSDKESEVMNSHSQEPAVQQIAPAGDSEYVKIEEIDEQDFDFHAVDSSNLAEHVAQIAPPVTGPNTDGNGTSQQQGRVHISPKSQQNTTIRSNERIDGFDQTRPWTLPSIPADQIRRKKDHLPMAPTFSPTSPRFPRLGLCHHCPVYFGHIHHICTHEECEAPSQNHGLLAQIPDIARGSLPNNARPDNRLPEGSILMCPGESEEVYIRNKPYAFLFWQVPGTFFRIKDIWYQLQQGIHGTLWINRLVVPHQADDAIQSQDEINDKSDRDAEDGSNNDSDPEAFSRTVLKDYKPSKRQDEERKETFQTMMAEFENDIRRHRQCLTNCNALSIGDDIHSEAGLLNVQIQMLSNLALEGFPNYFENFWPGRGFQLDLDAAQLTLTDRLSLERPLDLVQQDFVMNELSQHTKRLGLILKHVDPKIYPDLFPGQYAHEFDPAQTPYQSLNPTERTKRLKQWFRRLRKLLDLLSSARNLDLYEVSRRKQKAESIFEGATDSCRHSEASRKNGRVYTRSRESWYSKLRTGEPGRILRFVLGS